MSGLNQLGQPLVQEFCRGVEARNLRRMVKFSQAFPDAAIVSTLSTQLSWGHFVNLLPLKADQCSLAGLTAPTRSVNTQPRPCPQP